MLSARSFVIPILAATLFGGSAQAQQDAPAGLNLNVVPIDAPVVVVLRPAMFLKIPAVKGVYDDFTRQPEFKKIVDLAEPETIDEITLILLQRDIKAGADTELAIATNGAILVKSNKPREWKALAAAADLPVVKATHSGKDYFRISGDSPVVFGFYQPDDTTVIAASEATLQKMIEAMKAGGEAKPPKIAGVSAKTVAATTVDFVWLRELLTPQLKGEQAVMVGLAAVGPVWEKTTLTTVRLDLDDDQKVALTAENSCTDEDGAKAVEKTVEAILTLTRNVMPEYLKMLRLEPENRPQIREFSDLAEQAIKSAKLSREGTRVRLQVEAKVDLAKLAKLLH